MHFDSFFRDNVINGYYYVISCFYVFYFSEICFNFLYHGKFKLLIHLGESIGSPRWFNQFT